MARTQRVAGSDPDPPDNMFAARMAPAATTFGAPTNIAFAHVDSFTIAAAGARPLIAIKNLDPPPKLLTTPLS